MSKNEQTWYHLTLYFDLNQQKMGKISSWIIHIRSVKNYIDEIEIWLQRRGISDVISTKNTQWRRLSY